MQVDRMSKKNNQVYPNQPTDGN